MEIDKVLICRLCFEICKSGFKIIEDSTKETLHFLLLDLDLQISQEPVMCNDCVDSLKECFNFKTNYQCKMDYTSIKCEYVDVNDPEVHLNENTMNTPETFNNSDICRCCKELINCETSVLLMDQAQNVTTMLEKCFPELTLNGITDSTCIACYKSLQIHLAFISKCLAVEEKIKEYFKAEETNSKGQVELSSVLHFVSKNQLQNNICSSYNAVKVENACEETENEDTAKIKDEDLVEIEESVICNIEKEAIDIKMEQDEGDRFNALQAKHKNCMEEQLTSQEDTEEVLQFMCDMCTYRSKQKRNFLRHLLNHKPSSEVTMHKCNTCTYESRHKYRLSKHMLRHKDPSEGTMYNCEICTYQCRLKYRLSEHMLTHKNTSEVVMFKCEVCPYQSRRKSNLSRHILSHDQPSEVTMYKCKTCTYQSKHRYRLSEHMLTHKDPSEVVMYKCNICTYRTIHKHRLPNHMLMHKDSAEVVMYECEICMYQTRYKRSLSEHMLTHKDPSQVIMYKCELCAYQTKRKRDLSRHNLIHKTIS